MTKRRVTGLAPALALAIAAHAVLAGQQQPPAQPVVASGAISGVVVDSVTQKPIAGAVVQLSGTPANATVNPNTPPPGSISMTTSASGTTTMLEAPPEPVRPQRQLTDEQGRFVFVALPGDMSYLLTTGRYGYFDGAYGRRGTTTTSRRILLTDGQWFRDARIEMVRPSAINGRVLDESGDPVVGVAVKTYTEILVGGTKHMAAGPVVLTDDRGLYRIANLTPGRYLIAVPSVQHAVPAAMTTAELAGQTPQAAAAAGPPTRRDPSFGAGDYRTILGQNAPAPLPSASGTPQVYPTTFHPSARSAAEATAVQLQPGDDRQAVDIRLEPAQVFRISGRLDGPPDAVGGLSLRLMGAGLEALGRGSETATALVSGDGSFVFLNVPNGSYTIIGNRSITEYQYRPAGTTAMVDAGNAPGVRFTSMSSTSVEPGAGGTMLNRQSYQGNLKYQARQPVTVSGRDVANLMVPMQAGVTLRGTVVIESSAPAAMFVSIRAEAANGDPGLGQPNFNRSSRQVTTTTGDDEFVLEGLLPGAYILRGGSTVKSIMWNGRDYSDAPFDTTNGRDITGVVVTLTDKVNTLSGAVRDRTGQPAANTAVIAFPTDRTKWSNYGTQPTRIRSTAGSTAGAYSLRGLPAGDYLIVAVDDDMAQRWRDPQFLQAASQSATRVTLNWGDTQTVDLVLQEIR